MRFSFQFRKPLFLFFYFYALIDAFALKYEKISTTSARITRSVCMLGSEKVPVSPRDAIVASSPTRVALAFLTMLPFLIKTEQARGGTYENFIPTRIYQTKSGLQYFDIKEGVGQASPRFGQLISFHYTMYYRSSSTAPMEKIDSSYDSPGKNSFLHKHGNGRVIRGLDEAIHTMKPGGQRRAIIPKNVGYTVLGIGPLPLSPKARKRLGEVIDLLERDEGQLLFDVDLLLVADDENDQGYYEDIPVSQDEVRKLVIKSITETNPELIEKMRKTTPKEVRGI